MMPVRVVVPENAAIVSRKQEVIDVGQTVPDNFAMFIAPYFLFEDGRQRLPPR